MATKRAKSAPRCNKGCTDPDDPTQKALKAQCACSRKRSKTQQDSSAGAPAPAP
ncbi:unnamed protein product, partial [Tilletia laevis]